MNAEAILTEAERLGIRLTAVDGRIVAKPKGRTPFEFAEQVRAHKAALLNVLAIPAEEPIFITTTSELVPPEGEPSRITPAQSILETCRSYGVAIRVEPDGTLVLGRLGARADEPTQPWPSLIAAIEGNLEMVAKLVESGWTLHAELPDELHA